jgi:hypothetical protein
MKKGFILWMTFWMIHGAAAQDKIETDRPDQTETPVLTPKNYLQAEVGFNREKDGNISRWVHPTALFKYGINRTVELRLETRWVSDHTKTPSGKTNGFEAVEIGTKIALLEEKGAQPKTSLIAHVGLPFTSARPYRSPHLSPSFRFTMQNTIAQNMAIGYNAGAEWNGFTNTPTWLYTFAPGFNLGDKWYTYIEAFGFITKGQKPQHSLDAGLAYFVTNDFKLDVSAGFGLSSEALDHYVAVGFSYRLPLH